MHEMDTLKDMLTEELEKFARKGELTAGSLDAIHKLTDTVKNICKIEMLSEEDGAYSGNLYRDGGMVGRSYRGGQSRAQRRDSMGRYASEGRSYRDGRGYSRAEAKADIMDQIGELMEDANDQERQVLRRAMKSLENA